MNVYRPLANRVGVGVGWGLGFLSETSLSWFGGRNGGPPSEQVWTGLGDGGLGPGLGGSYVPSTWAVCKQTYRHTGLKTLSRRKLRMRAVTKMKHECSTS